MNHPTVRLYDEDPYRSSFEAKVVSCEPAGDGFAVVLDRTVFFPEQGGQTPDPGVLVTKEKEEIVVTDVQIRDEVIKHYVNQEIPAGTNVTGRIDWEHRFEFMQQHSAEHIFSGTVHRLHGYDNVGFHLSDNNVTMDFSGPLTEEQIREVESIVNRVVYENKEILVSFPTREELETIEYRSKKEIAGQLRLVTIPGVDACACCAPHVRRTGEIGIVKVTAWQNYKGGVRIHIACGSRALRLFREEHDLMNKFSNDFSVPFEGIGERVDSLKEEIFALKGKLLETRGRLAEMKLAAVPADQKHVILVEDEMEEPQMRGIVNALTEAHPGYCGIFAGSPETGYRFIIGIADGDAREALTPLRETMQVRGGGSPKMVQGTVTGATEESLRMVWQSL